MSNAPSATPYLTARINRIFHNSFTPNYLTVETVYQKSEKDTMLGSYVNTVSKTTTSTTDPNNLISITKSGSTVSYNYDN